METETVVMSSRRRMVLKPMSIPTKSVNKEENTANDSSDRFQVQPSATLLSPNSEKKRILLQDYSPPTITPTVQRNKVFLSYSADENNLSDTDDSDLDDDSTINTPNTSTTKTPQKSNKKLYCWIIIFLCWVVVQYWMITVAGFGAVFFAISALVAICLNTTKTDKKRKNTLSAYSVFNPQCTPIQGSADPKQLERELIFGGL